MENPYWHPYYKPHVVDFAEIKELCFRAFCIMKASSALQGYAPEGVMGRVYDHFYENAEAKLSAHLLDLAVRIRTFEDILQMNDEKGRYDSYVETRLDRYNIGSVGDAGELGAPRADLSLRQACNKIIHAQDVRYVYDNSSNDRDGDYSWGMTGTLELTGRSGRDEWNAWIFIDDFLAICVDVAAKFAADE